MNLLFLWKIMHVFLLFLPSVAQRRTDLRIELGNARAATHGPCSGVDKKSKRGCLCASSSVKFTPFRYKVLMLLGCV